MSGYVGELLLWLNEVHLTKEAQCEHKSMTVGDRTFTYTERVPPVGTEIKHTVLVLHGFTMKTTAMLSLFPSKWVPADVRLVLLDQPGHGRSHKGDEGDNFKGFAADEFVAHIDAFVQAAKLESFDLVGYSMGGASSILYTARHPERVKRAVLIAPGGVGTLTPVFDALVRDPDTSKWTAIHAWQTAAQFRGFYATFLGPENTKIPPPPSVIVAGLVQRRQRLPSDYFSKFVQASLDEEKRKGSEQTNLVTVAKMLPRADSKYLLIWGSGDTCCDPAQAAPLAAALGGEATCQLHMLEGMGHAFGEKGFTAMLLPKAKPIVCRWLFGETVPVQLPRSHLFRNTMLVISVLFALLAVYSGEVDLGW